MARVLFLQTVQFEFTGVMSISAYLKRAGHTVDLFLEGEEGKALYDRVRDYRPDLVAFSAMTGDHVRCLEIAAQVKQTVSAPILLGGPHPTFFPETVEHPAIDIVCRGEGEEAAAELCARLDRGEDYSNVRNLWVKRDGTIVRNEVGPGENDLDNYPLPDRDIYYKYQYLRDYPTKPFITARGCPYLCSFCFNRDFNRMYHGKMKVLRRHSAERAVEEMRQVKARFPLKRIFINDDIFILDQEWLARFLPMYRREIGLPFACNVRVNLVNEEIVRMLKEAGCYLVMFGIESGDAELRRTILNKNISDQQIRDAAAWFRRYGIRMKTFNIMGLPDETVEKAVKTIRLNAEIKVDYPWCSILQPYPRTELADIARSKGLLDDRFSLDNLEASFFSGSVLKQANIRQLTRLQKLFYLGVKMPWLIPVLARLVKLPLDRLFFLLFGMSYTYRFMRETDIGFWNTIKFAIRHRKNL
ncbi:MAG: radical SAM protein [Candidatus Zixiibacteriota bacterium]|nr:MAG: radical SAM protein [candidate division Zixibacteria bacterium]